MLKEDIEKDLKTAVKKKDIFKVQVLRFLLSVLYNQEIKKRTKIRKQLSEGKDPEELEKEKIAKEGSLTEQEVISVVSSEVKRRKETILEFSTYAGTALGEKKDKIESFIEKERAEIDILKKYLPEQLSPEEIKKLAKATIAALRASLAPSEREKVGIKDMGKVMAELIPQIKGRAEGKKVSEIVKELLS